MATELDYRAIRRRHVRVRVLRGISFVMFVLVMAVFAAAALAATFAVTVGLVLSIALIGSGRRSRR